MSAPTAGIFGLTGCAGDQLTILNAEDELLDIVRLLDVKDFLMASSQNDSDCDLDIALVEGAVVTERDEAALLRIRKRSKLLVAVGTCAVWGGVPTLDRGQDRGRLLEQVYGAAGRSLDQMPARAVHEVVKVDAAITGCPIEKHELIAALASLVNGDRPLAVTTPVCAECKMRENNCLLVEQSLPCLGPLTAGGCMARCPDLGIACIGCRGPSVDANLESALTMYEQRGIPREVLTGKLATFAPRQRWGGNGS
jgi:coenzyme F420-reducing hydrogenase gamma subunit